MNKLIPVFILALSVFCTSTVIAQTNETKYFWYEVSVSEGSDSTRFVGRMTQDPAQLSKLIKQGEMIFLEKLREFKADTATWKARSDKTTVYIMARTVVYFHPLDADPDPNPPRDRPKL